MPLYEYQCKKCGHRLEVIQMFSDKPLKKCPECSGALEKLISASSVQFKGSGWYVTDYAKKGTASAAPSATSSSDSSDSESAKKESKDSKEVKETKKDEKPRREASNKKQKKD